MHEYIAKSVSTLGVWAATAAILIWADFGIIVPLYFVTLLVAGFSTAVIWNYKISNIFQSRDEMTRSANEKMDNV
ncbi:hypothetical protein JW960_19600 [candidate division KSB1 bacterium]|nr:hypothetical protein [candidate division KSB1 bacterium]